MRFLQLKRISCQYIVLVIGTRARVKRLKEKIKKKRQIMDLIKQLDIRLPKDHFHPGESIQGIVVVETAQSICLKQIRMCIRGKAQSEWKVFVSGDKRTVKDEQFLLDERITVWDCSEEEEKENEGKQIAENKEDESENEEIEEMTTSTLKIGINEFPFSYQIPDIDLPCSFESRVCQIRYHLRVLLDIADVPLPPQGIKFFTIIGPLIDCNNKDQFLKPLFGAERRIQFCWCCRRHVATLSCVLERNAFCSGEAIQLKSFVENFGEEAVRLKVRLVQFCEFNAERGPFGAATKESQRLVLEYAGHLIGRDEQLDLITSHTVPTLPPTMVGLCRLLQVYYTLTVCLEFERSGVDDLHIMFPLTIGTIPFECDKRQFRVEYKLCCDHVEGGDFVDPQFIIKGFFGPLDEDRPDRQRLIMPFYQPVYLNIESNNKM